MVILKKAQAGTMQSSDLMVFTEPSDGLEIIIDSTVAKQYGHLIRAKVEEVLDRMSVTQGTIRIKDRGALDYAIDARVQAAVLRSQGA
ncbi:citrate lyase acyl carrier protein [Seleniivibrio woodruffii]|uniref:citrate lyase acyl carrier protein n=1 Tax=Seleniivibrio woodruffii TaxID=1078050 RepID=UPI0026EB4F89|nr:citrate lyase acyl carrier protein [Seleniivibrio woodruffii]